MSGELRITKTGNGSGNVSSQVGGIDCGGDCSERYSNPRWAPPAIMVLAASPAGGSSFSGWSGDGTTTVGNRRVVVMNGDKNVTAQFNATPAANDMRADLVVQNLKITPASTPVALGTSMRVSLRVRNIGGRPAAGSRLSLSVTQVDETTVSIPGVGLMRFTDTVETFSIPLDVGALIPSQYQSLATTFTVAAPELRPPGGNVVRRVVVFAKADADNVVNESSESNNGGMLGGLITRDGFMAL